MDDPQYIAHVNGILASIDQTIAQVTAMQETPHACLHNLTALESLRQASNWLRHRSRPDMQPGAVRGELVSHE